MNIEKCIKEAVEQEVREALKTQGASDTRSPVRVGNCVYIRTVTHHYTGRIVAMTDAEIILREAAWIADQGVMSTAIASGKLVEVEPYPDDVGVTVNRGAVCDACDWTHDLPRQQK